MHGNQYNQLLTSLNVLEHAHLTALSHSSGISSGWLKATAQFFLGHCIPGPEFVAAVCLWWRITLSIVFAFFVCMCVCMCVRVCACVCGVCLSTIDHCGDHLLECSHGHDVIVDIVYHVQSQSHSGVHKEQHILIILTWGVRITRRSFCIF